MSPLTHPPEKKKRKKKNRKELIKKGKRHNYLTPTYNLPKTSRCEIVKARKNYVLSLNEKKVNDNVIKK